MRLRSLLFVPGDRADRMEKALQAGADAVIFDLEDSVSLGNKPRARDAVLTMLQRRTAEVGVFVRINPLESELADADIACAAQGAADGVVLPKSAGGVSVVELEERLARAGDTRALILPIGSETPGSVFTLGSYGGVSPRLCGLTWGAEDLPAAIGAASAREADGRYTAPYEMVRALVLFGAAAAGVAAIETVYPAFSDLAGLADYAARGRRDGFSGMLAIHPAQVAVINAAFTPSEAELAWAARVVALFDANPGAGALSLDGKMVDAPHLKQARRLLDVAAPKL